MGTFLGQALKSRQGDREWIDFFALISSAFAFKEKTPLIPRFMHFSRFETLQEIKKAEKQLGALEKMRGFSVAVDAITKKGKGWSYHLIVLNSLEHKVQITPYERSDFKQAMLDYSEVEATAAKGVKIEPVLVSAGPIDNLRKAYPNFFLDMSDFIEKVNKLIQEVS